MVNISANTGGPARVGWTGELDAPELEAAYRERSFAHDRAVGRIVVAAAAAATLALGALDSGLVPGWEERARLWLARGGFAAASAAVLVFLPRRPAAFTRVMGGWYVLTVGLQVYVGSVWPAGHAEPRITATLAALMTYFIMPLPFRWRAAGAVLQSAGGLAVGAWLNPAGGAGPVAADVCWLGLVNGLGLPVAYRLDARHRQLFAALHRQAELAANLGRALAEVRTLRGLIRVCAWCRRVHADDGGWQQLEAFVRDHSHAEFTHGICPTCLEEAEAQVPCPRN